MRRFLRIITLAVGLSLVGVVNAPVANAFEVVSNIAGALVTAVQSVMEQVKAEAKSGAYGEISDWLVMIYKFYIESYDNFLEKMADGFQMRITAMELRERARVQLAQAESDASSFDVLVKSTMGHFIKYTPPKNEYLCRAITALSSAATSADYAREGSRSAAEAISNRLRCPTCDGSGPDYTRQQAEWNCKRKYGTTISGDPATCRDSKNITGTDGRKLSEAQVSPLDGGQIFEMPPMVSKAYEDPESKTSIVVNVPSDTGLTVKQEFWHAAWAHCFTIAGPRPTPAYGKNAKTPVGKAQRAMYNHCVASQNALVKQCTDLMAFYTRPNCTDSAALCKEQLKRCLAVENIINLDAYDNCASGLSPSEEQEIAQGVCKSSQQYLSNGQSGQPQRKMPRTVQLCEESDKSYRFYVEQLHKNYEQSISAMQILKPCWAAVEAMGRGGRADAGEKEERAAKPARYEPPDQKNGVVMHKISAEGSVGRLSGDPARPSIVDQ